MPFGQCNAVANLMCLMNDVLHPMINYFIIVYVDDILIFIPTWQELISHLKYIQGREGRKMSREADTGTRKSTLWQYRASKGV